MWKTCNNKPRPTLSNTPVNALASIILLLCSGDIQLNPGPNTPSAYPCGLCQQTVSWDDKCICCDECSVLYHLSCLHDIHTDHTPLHRPSVAWICNKCDSINIGNLTFHMYEFETSNAFSILSEQNSLINDNSILTGDMFNPKTTSSPKQRPQSHTSFQTYSTTNTTTPNSKDNESYMKSNTNNWRTMIINCQSLRGKHANFENVVDYTKPDLILGTESWLDSSITDSEVFPTNYNVYRKDRNTHGGGVFMAVKKCYNSSALPETDTNCEIIWAKVELEQTTDMYVSSFYRPPNTNLDYFDNFSESLQKLPQTSLDKVKILGGDFNLPDISWQSQSVKPGGKHTNISKQLLQCTADESLTQLQLEPTRDQNILDLYFTNRPGLAKHTQTLPGISDHDIVLVDTELKAKINKNKARKIYKFNKADWTQLKTEATKMSDTLLSTFSTDINENWTLFKRNLTTLMDKHIPSKTTTTRYSVPWLNTTLKRMTNKKKRLYKKFKKSKQTTDKQTYVKHKQKTQHAIRDAHNNYVKTILENSMDNKDPKKFWKYVKQRRQDNTGIAPLKSQGQLYSDSTQKADILNKQFQSVFTKDTFHIQTVLHGTKQPSIQPITITEKGVHKLLSELKTHKASGPDNIPNTILKQTATEITPIITKIFNQSIQTGTLPHDWTTANVTPIYKKNNRHDPANYRPISLTCVTCKLLEHIICKHILNHLEQYNILTNLQHGFRSGHSCETQLLITTHDLLTNYDKKIQTDMAILDFSKAFDTVPHTRLLSKLEHYGINGTINNWIKSFLTNRTQSVVVEGNQSPHVDVLSGVPQGTVLGPLLFLCHINDLPQHVKSQVRMFADDCLLYRPIKTQHDQTLFQQDLNSLDTWANMWGMTFNPSKCYIMRNSRSRQPLQHAYTLCGQTLEQVDENPYLGVLINNQLKWKPHINKTIKKANKVLGFLRRNLHMCKPDIKSTAYKALVRPIIEYSSAVWDPYLKGDIEDLEALQRRAARFVTRDYRRDSSVTRMLRDLQWQPLVNRRREARLTFFYKIVNDLVAIPSQDYLHNKTSCTRSRHPRQFRVLAPKTEPFRNSFFPKTLIDWNSLTENIATASTLDIFKDRIRNHYD